MAKGSPQASLYGTPSGLTTNYTPAPVVATRAPATTDTGFPLGQIWVDKTNGALYGLSRMVSGGSDWEILGSSTGQVSTLTGDSGTATPTAGNIQIATGANLTSAGAASAVTINLDTTISGLTSVTSGSFVTSSATLGVTYSANNIDATGSDANISVVVTPKGTGTLTIDNGGVSVTAGDIINSHGAVGGDVTIEVTNTDNTNGASRSGLEVAVGGASGGDPYLSFQISGVAASTMTMGLDNSASDLFVISNSGAIGTSNALTLSQAGALNTTTSITAGTTLTATLGAITATNGNLVLGTAGNKLSIATGANASVGSNTLVGGTVTVNTTAVTASSIIQLTRQSIGATGAAALGHLTVGTIVAGTSFVINAVQAADATALQASDVSVIGWMIVN